MSGRVEFETENVISPEEIEGHDFTVPIIRWRGWGFNFEGLYLPNDWEREIPRLSKKNPQGYSSYFDLICRGKKLDWELKVDEKTGLITEVKLNNSGQVSRVFLDTRFGGNGSYRGEDIHDLSSAVIYQDFLAHFLHSLTNYQIPYAYISGERGNYGSVDLRIPKEIVDSMEPTANEFAQKRFELKANNIAGQFGQLLKYAKYDDKGILDLIVLKEPMGKDCNYSFSDGFNTYDPHNVDSLYEAAALHGIAAEFINDLLKRKNREDRI
jgi:hypothetical protein